MRKPTQPAGGPAAPDPTAAPEPVPAAAPDAEATDAGAPEAAATAGVGAAVAEQDGEPVLAAAPLRRLVRARKPSVCLPALREAADLLLQVAVKREGSGGAEQPMLRNFSLQSRL